MAGKSSISRGRAHGCIPVSLEQNPRPSRIRNVYHFERIQRHAVDACSHGYNNSAHKGCKVLLTRVFASFCRTYISSAVLFGHIILNNAHIAAGGCLCLLLQRALTTQGALLRHMCRSHAAKRMLLHSKERDITSIDELTSKTCAHSLRHGA